MRLQIVWLFVGILGLAGCASGNNPPDVPDGSTDSAVDSAVDTAVGDSSPPDAAPDADVDTGTPMVVGTCEACEDNADCGVGAFCVNLTDGGRACVPMCNPDLPSCPRNFSCALDATGTGVDAFVCLPVGGPCCVDEDADGFGQGVACMGSDCADDDETVNPGATELCDGADNDCDDTVDEPPTDCASGRCTNDGDGTFSAVESASCMDAACISGTLTDCTLFTCEDGAEVGNACATTCDVDIDGDGTPDGDDDSFCIMDAHCDAAACVADEPNGGTCDEDSDCSSAHCDSGFCCDSGRCCGVDDDCPGDTISCETASLCEGTRGSATCVSNECVTMAGIPDDSSCHGGVMALDCGNYLDFFCDGTVDQPMPVCPTSCADDTECKASAHCDFGSCVPDRPAGASCTRIGDCEDSLFCTDGVCCSGECSGVCEACDNAGAVGACTPVPTRTDPAAECGGFSCAGYFVGFGATDSCNFRADVSDDLATCDGLGACFDGADLCEAQGPGGEQVDCDDNCQTPTAGTCTSTIPGTCTDLDDAGDTVTCGTGACLATVQRCLGGAEQMCSSGMSAVEGPTNPSSCNLTVDDDCDGMIDEGFPDVANASCANSRGVSMAVGAADQTFIRRLYNSADEHWYRITYPTAATGQPSVRVTPSDRFNFDIVIGNTCSSAVAAVCETDTNLNAHTYQFSDDPPVALGGRTRNVTWPAVAYVVVRRTGGSGCNEYTLVVGR